MSAGGLLVTMLLVGVGGGLGSVMRWGLRELGLRLVAAQDKEHLSSTVRPGTTVVANILACFLLGLVVARLGSAGGTAEFFYLMLAVGFCGGLSTMSTAAFDVVELVRRDFDPKAEHWSLGYAVTIEGLRGAAALAARGPDAPGRAALIGRARVTAEQNQRRFEVISGEVAASVLALREAQVNLRHVVQSRDITVDEIQSYAARVEDFVKIYRILRAP